LLDIHADIVSLQPKLARIKATTARNGKKLASAELLLSFERNEKLGLAKVDPALDAYLSQQV
jgi:hypothetical protein